MLVVMVGLVIISYSLLNPYARYDFNSQLGYCEIKYRDTPATPSGYVYVPLDVYVIDSPSYKVDLSDDQIRTIVDGASTIWEQYWIKLYIDGDIKRPNITLTDDDILLGKSVDVKIDGQKLTEKIFGDRVNRSDFNEVVVIFVKTFYRAENNSKPSTGIVPYDWAPFVAIIGDDSNKTWTLAHELGHVFNNGEIYHLSGIFNLMTSGCIKESYYPTVINQTQYANIFLKMHQIRHY